MRMTDTNYIPPLMTAQEAVAEASRCLGCSDAPCIQGCPARNDIVKFIRQIAQQNFRGAIRTVREANIFAGTCAYICPVGESCEMKCGAKLERPVKIGQLQRFVAEYERQTGFRKFKKYHPNGKKVGIIGAGPAGLSAAFYLVCLGFETEVFEAAELPGGILTYGIPDSRLLPEMVNDEIEFIKQMGVTIYTDSPIVDLGDFVERYDAVFIGMGAYAPVKIDLPGEELQGVFQAVDYLKQRSIAHRRGIPLDIKLGDTAAVFGGGNTAMDAASCAVLDGCPNVMLYYRRGVEVMPAFKDEIDYCRKLGIRIQHCHRPVAFRGDNNQIKSVTLIRTEPGEVDSSGRPLPIDIEGSEFEVDIDSALIAIGQSPTFSGSALVNTDHRGFILVDPENMVTSNPKVYAGGDAVNGGTTVVQAVAEGRKAAESIGKKFAVL